MRKHSYTQTVYIRFPEEIPQMFRQVLTMYEQNGHTVSYEETHNFNWGGKMPCSIANQHPTSQKKGVCPTAQTGCIFRNGDFGLCYMNDVEESTTFGNIFETPLSEILASDKYMKVLKDMERNIYTGICENCNEKW